MAETTEISTVQVEQNSNVPMNNINQGTVAVESQRAIAEQLKE